MDPFAATGFWIALFQIIGIDLVMSGDNAAVIALAARHLRGRQRHSAIFLGSLGAVVLRVLLTFVAAELLQLPYLQTLGGLLLLWVAYRLVGNQSKPEREEEPSREPTLWASAHAILVADAIMSLDNVLGLAAVARGDWVLLTLGLLISIALIVAGSSLLMRLMERYPLIILLGGALLGEVAGDLLLADPAWHGLGWQESWVGSVLSPALALLVAASGMGRRR